MSSESEALELIDAEISVSGLKSPTDEQALNTALSGLEGIQSLSIANGKVTVEYDPVRINKMRIGEAIAHAGYTVTDVETALASPIGDALHD